MSKNQNMTDKQKADKKTRISALFMLVIGVVLCSVDLAIIGIFLVGAGLWGLFSPGSFSKNLYCSQCGTKRGWDQAESIEWQVVGIKETDYTETNINGETLMIKVEVVK